MNHSKIANYQEITNAIEIDDINFLKENFMPFIKYYLEVGDAQNPPKVLELLLLASENNSFNFIKFLLGDHNIKNYFGNYLYPLVTLEKVLENAIIDKNHDLMLFLCQSTSLDYNPSIDSIDIYNIGLDSMGEISTINFTQNYQKKLNEIETLFLNIKKHFEELPYENALLHLQNILQHEDKELYGKKFTEQLEDFLYFAFKKDNSDLVQFLLNNIEFKNLQEVYKEVCRYTCPQSIHLIINQLYNESNNNINLTEGLIIAIKKYNNEIVKTILEQPYDSSNFDLAWSFPTALNINNFEAVDLILKKSLLHKQGYTHSVILDEYPYYDIFDLIASDISESNLMNSIKYLFENDIFNPKTYTNYSFQNKKFNFKTTPEKIFHKLVDKGYTEVLDFIFDNKYFNLDSNMINENLIKSVIYNTLTIDIGKKMADYIMMEFNIHRTSEFHNFLKNNINDLDILSNKSITKEINQYFLDYYDSLLFNELLSEKINKISNKEQKKKKV